MREVFHEMERLSLYFIHARQGQPWLFPNKQQTW